jgi:His-Xaa-Ser system protein HxsD
MAPKKTAEPVVQSDPERNVVTILVDTGVYPKEAIYGAAYIFIDTCYVLLDAPKPSRISVQLRGQEPLDEKALDALAGDFLNELLAQTLREMICAQNRPLLEAVVGQAISGAVGPTPEPELDLSELDALALDDEPFDDPLGIAMSWEEKYGKEKKAKKKLRKDGAAPDPTVSEG